ncbi:MAG: type II toxin-antitoxin system VapC family toxin, partial [Gemmatimonadota bacterium]
DTSALIALLMGHEAVARASRELDRIVVPVVVLGELLVGRVGAGRGARGEREVRAVVASPRVEVAALGVETAERYAVIRQGLRRAGRPVPANDIWIAASAMEQGLLVLTLDRHYLEIPQILVELFEPA